MRFARVLSRFRQYRLPGSQCAGKREWAGARLTVTLDDMLPLHQWLALAPAESNESELDTEPPADATTDWLFAASGEAVLIIDADTGFILRANPAASALLSLPPSAIIGAEFLAVFDDANAEQLRDAFAQARASGSSAALIVRERGGGRSLSSHLSLVRTVPQTYLLARLESIEAVPARGRGSTAASAVMAAIDSAPMGFIIAAADFHVEYANRAFAKMVDASTTADVRGNSILRWLRFSSADLSRLSARLSQRQAADLLTTALYPNHGSPKQVEVCAVPVPDGFNTQWGFTVRPLPLLN